MRRDSLASHPSALALMPRDSSAAKILFVTNNNGTSFTEVNAVVTVVIVALWARMSIRAALNSYEIVNATRYSNAIERALDVMTLIAPVLTCMFAIESATRTSAVVFLGCLVFWAAQGALAVSRVTRTRRSAKHEIYTRTLRCDDAITLYRYTLAILTVTAILAIDFTPFPRRLGKTETFGVSLMDMGGGAFVFSSGIVSRFARGRLNRSFKASMMRMAPLLMLGIARLLITSAVGYHSIESEYGRHWNFFFTLAGVNIFADAIAVPPTMALSLGLCIALVYQCVLFINGTSAWILQTPDARRHPTTAILGFLSKNREGLCSILGYYSIHLIAVQIGWFLAQPIVNFRRWLCLSLGTVGSFWSCALALHFYVESVSRRSGNAAYVLWVAAYNLQVIVAFVAISRLSWSQREKSEVPKLVTAISSHQLAVFLLGNVLTGLVNLSMDTIAASSETAWFVMSAYVCAICACALMLRTTVKERSA